MDHLPTMASEARNPVKNHHRRYEVTLGRDLFDDWTVDICYGRCGRVARASDSPVRRLAK
jgi:hypothetical protein